MKPDTIDPVFESLYDALYRLVGKRLIDVGYVERQLFDIELTQLGHNKTHWYCWDKVKNSEVVKKHLNSLK